MLLKGVFLALFGLGVFILVQVIMPVVVFKSWEIFALDQNQMLVDPKLGSANYESNVLGVSIETVNDFPAFVAKNGVAAIPYKQFTLSIPAINLDNVTVKVYSNDFEETLAQLPGTAFPGEKGNVFISGHSSIIDTVKLSEKRAWFVNLPKIKKNDEITINAAGQKLVYVVQGMKVVDPKDVSVIEPPDKEGRYVTLMTCVPPGFNTKRLIVLAKLK